MGLQLKATPWTDVTYSASNFSVDGTGNSIDVSAAEQQTYSYNIVGTTMFLAVILKDFALTASASDDLLNVKIKIPGGKRSKEDMSGAGFIINADVSMASTWTALREGTTLDVQPVVGGWTGDDTDNGLRCVAIFEVEDIP